MAGFGVKVKLVVSYGFNAGMRVLTESTWVLLLSRAMANNVRLSI